MRNSKHPLEGKYLLTFTAEGALQYQAFVENVFADANGASVALCQLFSALDGSPTSMELFGIASMLGRSTIGTARFRFYSTKEDWHDAFYQARKYDERRSA